MIPSTSYENINRAKRIVYRMKNVIKQSEIDEDFELCLKSLKIKEPEKSIGIEEFSKIRDDIKKSIKHAIKFGEPDGVLKLLPAEKFEELRKKSLEMLLGDENSRNESESDNGSRYGEDIIVRRIQNIHTSSDDEYSRNGRIQQDEHPEPPRPVGIPKIDVLNLRNDDISSENERTSLKSGDPIRSPFMRDNHLETSYTARNVEDLLKRLETAEKQNKIWEKELKKQKEVSRIIVSRPRTIPRQNIGIQTEVFEKEFETKATETKSTETKEASVEADFEEKKIVRIESESDSLSDMSDGEIRLEKNSKIDNLVVVRSDGNIITEEAKPVLEVTDSEVQTSVRTPRVEDYIEEETNEDDERTPRVADIEVEVPQKSDRSENILMASSGSRLRVDDRTISSSSVETFESASEGRNRELSIGKSVISKMYNDDLNVSSSDADDESNSISV